MFWERERSGEIRKLSLDVRCRRRGSPAGVGRESREGVAGKMELSWLRKVLERLRPYHVENTGSRPITEVKQRRARLVLGWVTAWEYRVL